MEKRYESDMTRKEKRQNELKKLKSMTFKQKAAYIWVLFSRPDGSGGVKNDLMKPQRFILHQFPENRILSRRTLSHYIKNLSHFSLPGISAVCPFSFFLLQPALYPV